MSKTQEARLSKLHRKSEFRNLEVFELNYTETETEHGETELDLNGGDDTAWFYWVSLPGCLPESEPFGPFSTMKAALDHAEQLFSDEG